MRPLPAPKLRRAERQPIRRALALLLTLACVPALAAESPPITGRAFALDLYSGAVFGSSRIIGMGGTGIALAEGSAYTQLNVAAAAVRPATSNGSWDWDFHFDWMNPSLGSDFDNNGDPVASVGHATLLTFGALGQYREWGLAFSGNALSETLSLSGAESSRVSMLSFKVILARAFVDRQLTVGLGVESAGFTLEDASARPLLSIAGSGLELGGQLRPKEADFRLGLSLFVPMGAQAPTVSGCDPMDCEGLILPDAIEVPWRVGLGASYRFGPTPWNRQVEDRWRDERAVTLSADLLLTGATHDGYGLEAFVQKKLQRSGRSLSASVRVGAEYEWIPGWLRIRGGSYWEPGRFDGVGGRLHATFGLDFKIFAFDVLGTGFRLRLGLTGDTARGYGNGALSIGFW
jgi:hypothetical protein